MSHRSDCPDRWTAEREGERAQEWGRGRYANPYDDPFHSGRKGIVDEKMRAALKGSVG